MSYCEIKNPINDDKNVHVGVVDDQLQSQNLNNKGVRIFYKTYGRGPTKVLLIIGLAGTHESWGPQIEALAGTLTPNHHHHHSYKDVDADADADAEEDENGIQVCAFDNRGMGRSSIPTHKSQYTTTIMAKDAIALMDHLGWTKAHVVGHSMGAMIACKLAAIAPHRLLSLALLNVTGGGFQCFPKIDRQFISIAIRFLKAKTPEQRAAVDLDTHYTKEYLDEYVGLHTRRTILYQEYVKGISSSGMQSNYGFEGQINACWTHKLTSKEIDLIRTAGFLISVIHGRYDIIAQINHARRLAEKLQPVAKMVDLHGAHLVSHERPKEVNQALLELIEASKLRVSPQDWSNLPRKGTGSQVIGIEILSGNVEGRSSSFILDILKKLYLCILYIFGLFVVAFEQARRIFRRPMPIRVGTSIS